MDMDLVRHDVVFKGEEHVNAHISPATRNAAIQNGTGLLELWAGNSNDIPREDEVLVRDATGSSQRVGIAAEVRGDYGN